MATIAYRVSEDQVSNGAEEQIIFSMPYIASVTVEGVAPLLFHNYNVEAVIEKGKAAKNSTAKKTDNVESYVYRTEDRHLGIPGVALTAAIVDAGRFMQDPRSPRKSAMDLCKAGIVPLTDIAPLEPLTTEWDYIDQRRVVVQRSAVPRERPAMRKGWRATFDLMITTPEYIGRDVLQKLLSDAGRLCGLLDFRPTFGRFVVCGFEVRRPDEVS